MYGLEAIAAHNGWAISVVGVTIVFTGLVLLSLCLSQLHKALYIWENWGDIKFFNKDKAKSEPIIKSFNLQQKETARQFRLLTRTMDDNFAIPKLLRLAKTSGLEKPHSSLNTLLKSEIIKPDQKGYYTWDRDKFNKLVS